MDNLQQATESEQVQEAWEAPELVKAEVASSTLNAAGLVTDGAFSS